MLCGGETKERGKEEVMNPVVRAVVVLMLGVVSSGCVAMFSGFIFSPTEGEVKGDGKSIAVVAGVNNQMNLAVAESMSEALVRNSTFKVMTPKQVAQRIKGNSYEIQGPYNGAYMEIDVNWSKTDRKKAAEILKKTGADYVYIIWMPTGYCRDLVDANGFTMSRCAAKSFPAVAQLFARPDAKVAAQGRFSVTASRTFPILGSISDEKVAEALTETTDAVSKIIAEKSGAKR